MLFYEFDYRYESELRKRELERVSRSAWMYEGVKRPKTLVKNPFHIAKKPSICKEPCCESAC